MKAEISITLLGLLAVMLASFLGNLLAVYLLK